MIRESSTIFVAGHQRPDADAAVAAAVLARLRQAKDRRRRYRPILLGEPNPQTRWLFEQARIDLPPVRTDLRYTVAELMNRKVRTLPDTARLAEALPLLQGLHLSVVPILGADGRVAGVLSNRLPQSQYFYHFNVEDFVGELLTLPDIVSALRLRPVNRAPWVARPGVIRVAAGAVAGGAGDIMIGGADAAAVRRAAAHGAQAIILADCSQAEARALARGLRVPVYFFRGSLLALISGLSLAIPVRNIMAAHFLSLRADQRVDDVRDQVARAPHALPVLDAGGHLLGIFSRTEALQATARPLIVVDHFERTQTVMGIDQAQLVEIVDHHRVGNLETTVPIRVDCRPVGSTSTIIACQFAEAGLKPSRAEALLLLGAIISDTLLLTSPTTTAVDRRRARELARRAGVELGAFGREVLGRNDELATGDPALLVQRDLKEFSHGELRFAAAQIETVDLGLLTPARRDALRAALETVRGQLGCALAALIVTDVFRGESRLLVCDQNPARQDWLLESASAEEGRLHPGMVSRKQQLLPLIFRRLKSFRG